MTTPGELLAKTDRLARDLLADPDTSAGLGPYQGWLEMINQTADAWRAAGQAKPGGLGSDPFLGIQSMINNVEDLRGSPLASVDARVAGLTVQLVSLTSHYHLTSDRPATPSPRPVTEPTAVRTGRVQDSVLHAGYLITHATGLALRRELAATMDRTLLAEVGRARDTVEVVEHILDVHLHKGTGRSSADQRLDTALTRWIATAHQIVAEQPPEPKNNYIISDVQHGLLVHTAALLAVPGQLDAGSNAMTGVRERLLPALQRSAEHWRDVRQAWARFAAPTTGISRELADAARALNQALRDPELDHHGEGGHLLTGALAAAVGTARGLADAFRSERLQAPTEVVVTLTRDVLSRLPETNPYQVFMGMSRHEGRAPIALPELLRDNLTQTALRNVESARTVRSGSHGLLHTSTHIPPTVHRVRRPSVEAAERAVTSRPRDAVGPRR